MAEGLGRDVTTEVFVDSSAALAFVNRKGCGKLRHVRVGQLWVQQLAEDEEVKFRKVMGGWQSRRLKHNISYSDTYGQARPTYLPYR